MWWPQVLYYQQHVGRIDRVELLHSALEAALSDEANRDQRSGTIRFVTLLEPTDGEIAHEQPVLQDYLRSDFGPAVSFALKLLTRLIKPGTLDVENTLVDLADAMRLKAAAQPKAAVRFVKAIVKKHAEAWPEADRCLAVALEHDKSDVREAAMTLLESRPAKAPPTDTALWHDALTHIAADTAQALRSWLGEDATEAAAPHTSTADLDELLAHCESVPADIRQRCGLDKAITAVKRGDLPPAYQPTLADIPSLATLEPIEPVADIDDLVHELIRCSRWESGCTAIDIERIMDGISRFGATPPDEYGERVAPLAAAVNRKQDEGPDLAASYWPLQDVFALLFRSWGFVIDGVPNLHKKKLGVFAWLKSQVAGQGNTPELVQKLDPLWRPVAMRLLELAERIQARVALPSLALPTHAHGWIDPRVLVERLAHYDGHEIPEVEFTVALHRLAYEHRDQACRQANALPPSLSDAAAAIRIACGHTDAQCSNAAWSTAAHSGANTNPRLTRSDISWTPEKVVHQKYPWGEQTYTAVQGWALRFEAPEANPEPTDLLSIAAHKLARSNRKQSNHWDYGWPINWGLGMLTLQTPAHPEYGLALAAAVVATGTATDTSVPDPWRHVVDVLLERDRPWTTLDHLLVFNGLIAANKFEFRAIAIDALIEAVFDGRADANQFAGIVKPAFEAVWPKRNRLCLGLKELIPVSPLHAAFAATVLDTVLIATADQTRGLNDVLEPLFEATVASGHPLSDDAHSALQSIKGSGKAAKAAKKLLKLEPTDRTAVLAEALSAHLARGERWAKIEATTLSRST